MGAQPPTPSLMADVDSNLRSIVWWKYLITSDLTNAFYPILLSKSLMKYCTRVATPYRGVTVYTRWECLDLKRPLRNLCFVSSVIVFKTRGGRWLSGRVSDSGARGPGFETYRRRVVSLSKTLYSPKVLVNYPGSDGSVPT